MKCRLSIRQKNASWFYLLFIIIFFLANGCKKNKQPPNNPPPPPKSSEKAITLFRFDSLNNSSALIANVSGNIGPDTITVTLNIGTVINNLAPTIIHTGISIFPLSNVARNFTSPVDYTVTAEDGSTKKYTVKIVLVKANQKIYVGSDDGNLYALNTNTGALLWKYTTGGAIQSSPTIVNNTVFVGSYDKNLYAIDATTGLLKWKYLTAAPIREESPVVSNNVVFISCANAYPSGYIYAIDAVSGLLKWSLTSIPVPTSPTVSGGKVFVCAFGGSYYALDELTGNTVWSKGISAITRTNPAVNAGKLYVYGNNGLNCVDAATGNTIWNTASSVFGSGPAIDNGTAYISSVNSSSFQYVEAFNSTTGILKWQYSFFGGTGSNYVIQSYPVASGDFVYPGHHQGFFYALNSSNGTEAWRFGSTQAGVWFANPTTANGVVYIGANDKNIYALEATTGKMIWKFLTNGFVYSGACVVDSDGEVFHSGASGSKN